MYIGPWQEMHLARVVASLRKADGDGGASEEKQKNLAIALEAASSSRRKLRDVSGLPQTGGRSSTPPPPAANHHHHHYHQTDASDISTFSNSPVSIGRMSLSTTSSSLSHTGMTIISATVGSGGGGRGGEEGEGRIASHLDSSASVAFVLGGGAKKKHRYTHSSATTSSTGGGGGGGGGNVNVGKNQANLVQSKNSVSQVERMRKLYVSGGLIEEDEEGDVHQTELDNELASLTSITFKQNPQQLQLQQQQQQQQRNHVSPPKNVGKEGRDQSNAGGSSGMIGGTISSPQKHGQTERERRLIELIAVQAAQQEALSGQLQHQARVQAEVQNRLMTLLQEDDVELNKTQPSKSVTSKGGGTVQSTRQFPSPTVSPSKAPRVTSNALLHSSPSSSSSSSGSGSLLGGKYSSRPQHSPLSSKSSLLSSSSSLAYSQGGILAELEADLERLGIDVTKQDHLLIESPPPAGKPITVTENSTSAETGQTSFDASSAASASAASAAYMNQQQQQQYMQWLQWQNYYQQQNQWYQMQMMQQQQLQQQLQQQQQQQQQQQLQQYPYPDVIQPIQSHVPVEATSTQSLPAQSAVEPSAVWTGHASEVDRLRSIFGRKR